ADNQRSRGWATVLRPEQKRQLRRCKPGRHPYDQDRPIAARSRARAGKDARPRGRGGVTCPDPINRLSRSLAMKMPGRIGVRTRQKKFRYEQYRTEPDLSQG